MPTLDELKEIKLPKYEKGAHYNEWSQKYLSASSGRSRAVECLNGAIMTEYRNATNDLDRETLKEENKRAVDDLCNCLPYGRLSKCVVNARSDVFPDGCAATAWSKLEAEITEITNTELETLKNEFESLTEIPLKKNPKETIREMENLQWELEHTYGVTKPDNDIIDLVLKACHRDYKVTVGILKNKKRMGPGQVTLGELKSELSATHHELKLERAKRKEEKGKIQEKKRE